MGDRRLVGIDLGITSAHTVRVLAGDTSIVCRPKAVPTLESLGEVERAAVAGAVPGTRLEVVMEPTGPAWLPIAVFFGSRGHTVYRVSSAKAADLRRFLSRHAKSNGIDADTLARLPLVDPTGLHPLVLPAAPRAALDRRVRACDRLTQQAAGHKRRLKDLVRQLLPVSPLVGELRAADLAALELYAEHPAVAFAELAAEVQSEVRLLRATQAELEQHATQREACSRRATRPPWPAACPAWPPSAGPRWSPPWAQPAALGPRPSSGPSPAWPPRPPRPATPTARANPSARPATGCCGPP